MDKNEPKPASWQPIEGQRRPFAYPTEYMGQPVVIADAHPAARILEEAINRAVRDLEGQGSRSDRIALQLLTALAKYAAETGT